MNGHDSTVPSRSSTCVCAIVLAFGLVFTGFGIARAQIVDTTLHVLDVAVARPERYSLEVSFPSAPGARTIVDAASHPALGDIDPSAIPNRTIVVYRDGRVVLGGTSTPSVRPSTVAGAPALVPRFAKVEDAGFTPYYAGTVNPAWGDYDRDGDPDLPMFRNEGDGRFTEIPGFRHWLDAGNYHGSAWSDFDADGDVDLAMLSYDNVPTISLLLRNDGGGVFTDIAPSQGMNVAGRGETAVWGDFDNDGDPDLFAPYYAHVPPYQSFMYRNDGGGSFTDVSDDWGVAMRDVPESLKPEGAAVVDWDDDGDLDLYCASHFFLNDGAGHFTDARADLGLPAAFDEGSTFVDIDSDGDFDLYVRNPDIPRLFRNDAGHFVDVTAMSGLPAAPFYWGDSWADADNDGDVDLLVYDPGRPAHLMLNRGDGRFVADAEFEALDARWGASAWADYDRDGDLDFIDGGSPFVMFASRLDGAPGFDQSYLRVHVVDADSLENQHGATIRLRPTMSGPDGITQTRAVGVGAAYLTFNEYTAHFGLGVAGTVSRFPDLAGYTPGTVVQLTAHPAPGYHFAGWEGDLAASQNPIAVTMDFDHRVVARFERDDHSLAIQTIGAGSVTRSPERPSYLHGSRIALEAVPAPGWSFVGWSGDAAGSLNPTSVLIDRTKSVTASFAINSYPLDVTALGAGSIVKSPDQASYTYGSSVQLTATPAFGHHFVHWGGDAAGTANPIALAVEGPRHVTASFEINTYPLEVVISGGGTVVRNLEQPVYEHGARVRLTATAGEGHRFVGWSGDASGSSNPVTVTMDRPRSITAHFEPIERRYWVGFNGGGDGINWTDPANWSDQAVPGPAEEVVLDHSAFASDYTVILPGGTVTTSIARLTILPKSGRTITLVLPGTNRGKPGLRVGDGALGVADILLGARATLRNESGVNNANGILLASSTADSIAIENGASYVHATAASPGPLVAQVARGAGSERGAFVYHVPGRTAFAVDASNVTYGTLVLQRDPGDGGYTIAGGAPLTVRGDLEIGANVTLSSSMTSELVLQGGIRDSGSVTLPASQSVRFDGESIHRLSGTGTLLIHGPTSVPAACTLAVACESFANNGTMQVDGALRIEAAIPPGGSGEYRYGAAASLVFAHASGSFDVHGHPYWPAVQGPSRVAIESPDGITMHVPRTISDELATRGPIAGAERLTLPGTTRLLGGGSFDQPPTYGEGSMLVYRRGGDVGPEWVVGDVAGVGVPRDIAVDAATETLRVVIGRHAPGDLRILSGVVELPAAGFEIGGNLEVNGALQSRGATLRMKGGAEQTICGTGTIDLATLALQKSAGFVRLTRDLVCVGDSLRGALEFSGSSDRLELGGRRLVIRGRVGGTNATGSLVGGSGAALEIHANGDAGALRFTSDSPPIDDLVVDLAAGHVTLATPISIAGTLALVRGCLEASAGAVTLLPGAAVTRDSGHVAGPMKKTLSVGAPPTTFEVGTLADYAPVSLALDGLTEPVMIQAVSEAGDHPELESAPFDDGLVHHRWSLAAEGALPGPYRATFHYLAGERDAGADSARLAVRCWAEGEWRYLETGSRGPTSVEALGSGLLGDYAIGEVAVWSLTDSVSGLGAVTRVPDRDEYEDGAPVTLTAVPALGHSFAGWAGDVAGSDTTASVVMNGARHAVATFVDAPPVTRLLEPDGGELLAPGSTVAITWEAIDPLGVESVALLFSRHGSAGPFDSLATGLPNTGHWEWVVPLPPTAQGWLRVVARDSVGGEGVDESDTTFAIGGSLAGPGGSLPAELGLALAGANPVRARARFVYSLPVPGEACVRVLDVQGREVAVLARGQHSAGRYDVEWSAAIGPRPAPAGIYFVRLDVNGAHRVRRIVVAR